MMTQKVKISDNFSVKDNIKSFEANFSWLIGWCQESYVIKAHQLIASMVLRVILYKPVQTCEALGICVEVFKKNVKKATKTI